jgi:hypothetical protein
MPFRHVVMFKWVDDIDPDHVAKVRDRFDSMPVLIEEIGAYSHGSDVGVTEGNFDYVVVADFANVADFRAYRSHPDHVLLVEELITGHIAERAAVQYQT